MKFNIDDYKGSYAMHCKTEEEARSFCDYLHRQGKIWCSGRSYEGDTHWYNRKKHTAYGFNNGTYSSVEYYREDNYTILEWADFMNDKFTKADLKTGDVIRRRNGQVEIVNLELGMFILTDGWNNLDNIRDDLTSMVGEKFDIIAVRRPKHKCDCVFDAFDSKLGTLVYEREEPVEMTLAEVCKLLGKNIKIIK